jgi:hypothetical protein
MKLLPKGKKYRYRRTGREIISPTKAGYIQSARYDLLAKYGRMSLEVGKYAEEGASLLIDHGWLEQPPHSYIARL